MEKIDKKNIFELRKLTIEELKKYYVELRKYEYENKVPLKGIEIRKKIHKLLVSLIKIDRFISKEELIILGDKRKKTSKPIIYACTHIGGNDIQRTFEAIQSHAYLFLGDPEGLYKDFSGLLLYLNGVICLETSDKTDRKIAMERAIELLESGGDLLIYPEGAWNITENLPVLKLYKGTVNMALKTGADIIPIAIEQYDKTFYVNIGENINFGSQDSRNINELNKDLRDALATLKWEIWEKQGIQKRDDLILQYKDNFQQNIIERCEYGFTIDDVLTTMYKDPNEATYDEVFSFVKKLSL